MSPDPPDDLRALLDLAREYLRAHDDLRAAVAAAGRALSALAAWAGPAAPTPSPPGPAVPDPADPRPAPTPPPAVPIRSLPPLTFAPPPPVAPVAAADGKGITPQPLKVIAARCRLKAEACRLAGQLTGGIDDRAARAGLTDRSRSLPDCYLWMLDPGGVYSDRPRVWADLAGAFDAAAGAADLLDVWDALPDPDADRAARDVLYLAAEAQAMLYTAVADVGRRGRDSDQLELYISVKDRTKVAGVFVDRYMTIDDPADAAGWGDLARRISACTGGLRGSEDRTRQRKKAFDRLRHKTRRLRDDPVGTAGEWPRVVELLDELVAGGLPPSNPEVRDLVLPVLDLMPGDLPLTPPVQLVLREIDRYLATRPAAEEPRAEEPTREVAAVRELLAGRQVVLIGGLVRPHRRDALIEAFGLDDLQWVTTVDHESVSVFEAPIARPEVAVVLLAVRWSNHSYGDVREYCDRFGKLLVRLPGGYHPNQVAHQILTQVGNRLRAAG